jgi:hypothetical protein
LYATGLAWLLENLTQWLAPLVPQLGFSDPRLARAFNLMVGGLIILLGLYSTTTVFRMAGLRAPR